MLISNLKVLQYELENKNGDLSVTLDRICELNCERWAIKYGEREVLSKKPDKDGYFVFHRSLLPSPRGEVYYTEYRWKTEDEALEFWKINRRKIIATNKDRRWYYDNIIKPKNK